jgi:hypothetical protein
MQNCNAAIQSPEYLKYTLFINSLSIYLTKQ